MKNSAITKEYKYDTHRACCYTEILVTGVYIHLNLHDKNKSTQEWSSMESNSYDNWDEIEIFFGHLVFGNKLANCNWQLVICI